LLNFLGRALGAQGRYAEAVPPMRRLVELAPADNQAKQNLAVMERLAAEQAARPQAR
jgi:Flp pilus assembly protein TadD